MTIAPLNTVDPFASFGAQADAPQGQFLKFSRGEWIYGQDLIELALGSRFAANMMGVKRGWRKWENKTVTDERMDLVIDMIPMPTRAMLGDTDKGLWESDEEGRPRDPWAETYELQLISATGDAYIYSSTSNGGKRCFGKLSKQFYADYRQRPGQVPIVELGRDSYKHETFGKVYTPMLTIVDWTGEDVLSIGSPSPEVVEEDEIPFDDDGKTGAAPATRQMPDTLAANASAKPLRLDVGRVDKYDTLAANASAKPSGVAGASAPTAAVRPSGYDTVMAERDAQKAAALQASATPKPVKRARF